MGFWRPSSSSIGVELRLAQAFRQVPVRSKKILTRRTCEGHGGPRSFVFWRECASAPKLGGPPWLSHVLVLKACCRRCPQPPLPPRLPVVTPVPCIPNAQRANPFVRHMRTLRQRLQCERSVPRRRPRPGIAHALRFVVPAPRLQSGDARLDFGASGSCAQSASVFRTRSPATSLESGSPLFRANAPQAAIERPSAQCHSTGQAPPDRTQRRHHVVGQTQRRPRRHIQVGGRDAMTRQRPGPGKVGQLTPQRNTYRPRFAHRPTPDR